MSFESDEEVVADSEDEISPYSVGHKGQMVSVDGLTSAQDTVQTTTVPAAKKSNNISFFTENPTSKSGETSISSFAPNTSMNSLARTSSRPRPRPAYKGTAAIANAISSIGTSPSAHSPLASTTATSFRDVQMGSSDPASRNSPKPDATFSFDIAERAKMRSRNASKLTPPISLISTPPPIVKLRLKPTRVSINKTPPEVINLTSDEEDELALPPLKPLIKPRAKSKPSPKSASKIGQTETAKRVNSSRHTALSSESRPTNTRPTSVSSQLPPSTASMVPNQDHPPIAFLPDDSDADIFLSSSPLFSSPPAGRTKRKRQEASTFDVGDNMDVDAQTMPPPRFFGSSSPDTQGSLPPPPPLFAPSSSSVNDSGIELDSPVPVSSKPGAKEITGKKKTSGNEEAPKKGKKKAQNVDDDDFELGADRPPPRKKTKPDAKAKKGGKKGAEVVDPKSSKVFKSSEFIEVDEDHDDLFSPVTDRVSTMVNPPAVGTSAPSAQPQSDLTSVSDSDASAVPQKKGKKKATTEVVVNSKRKPRKGKPVVMSDDEDDGPIIGGDISGEASNGKGKEKDKTGRAAKKPDVLEKPADESDEPEVAIKAKENRPISHNASPPASTPKQPAVTLSSRSYSIAARTKSTPMSELIRRVNSLPGSPFAPTPQRGPVTPTSTAYSPYLKASRSALSRIAPLHPNRRTPPPPLPRPPPPKKTKKQLEREEKWEEELQEGVEGWATLTDEERAAMRRAKRAIDEGWEE